MKKVVIALDFDSSAFTIAKKGYELAKALGARVILMHVASQTGGISSFNYSPITGFGIFSNEDIIVKNSAPELKNMTHNFLKKIVKQLGDETIQIIIKNGKPAESIIAVCEDLHAEMLVVGTHRRGGLEKMLLGSVAEDVLHHGSVPVFIIPIKTLILQE
jgi:nucleotide-binding universal stress UspA family protein